MTDNFKEALEVHEVQASSSKSPNQFKQVRSNQFSRVNSSLELLGNWCEQFSSTSASKSVQRNHLDSNGGHHVVHLVRLNEETARQAVDCSRLRPV